MARITKKDEEWEVVPQVVPESTPVDVPERELPVGEPVQAPEPEQPERVSA